jgi:hypothetical protein
MKLGLGHSLSGGRVSGGGAADTSFTFTMITTNGGSASNTFVLPLADDGTINMDVDWGDSSTDTITAYNQAEVTHVYSATGTYTIKISGTIRGWKFNAGGDCLKILDISAWGDFNFTNERSFRNCTNLTSSATDIPTISSANMSWTFVNCYYVNPLMDNWDMSGVTDMTGMLGQCSAFNQDLSSWDISLVTAFSFFASNTTMSTANYDALLRGWEALSVQAFQQPNFGNATYTGGGVVATARANLIAAPNNWTITDGGIA